MADKCNKVFSTSQAEELIKTHGLRAILNILSIAARANARDGDHPGYDLVATKLYDLTNLIKR